jgi:hypothetical protein
MNTLRKGRADLSESQRRDLAKKMTEGSPNEVVGQMVDRVNKINESSDKLLDVMRGLAGKPTKEQQIEADQANSRILQKTVSTFDFVASPKTMESLQSKQEGDLGALAFGKLFNIAKKKQQGFSGMEM